MVLLLALYFFCSANQGNHTKQDVHCTLAVPSVAALVVTPFHLVGKAFTASESSQGGTCQMRDLMKASPPM
jgi:hypothetical protein